MLHITTSHVLFTIYTTLRAPGTRDSVTCKRYEKGLLFKT